MRKLFRTIFGRFSLIAIGVILQIVVIYFLLAMLNEKFIYAQLAMNLISWIVLSNVPLRAMPTEGKLTWVFLIFAFPIFGALLYILFSKNFMSSRQKRMQKRLEVRKDLYNYKNEDYESLMKQNMSLKAYGQMEYIYECNHQIGFLGTNTKFYASGEEYFEDIVKELKKAKNFIFLEYFIIEEGKFFGTILDILCEKVKEGVEVRVMYDDIGSIHKLPPRYAQKLRKLGIKCIVFNKFIALASAVHNNRDHRKILVIDGKVGFTGGINLADEYINQTHPFGHWKDSGIKIEGPAVDELTFLFVSNYDLQQRKMDQVEKYLNKGEFQLTGEGVVVPYADGPRPAYLEYVGENVYLNMINQAERYIWITTPYLIIDGKLKTALENAAKRGVDVRIVTPHIPDKKIIFMITRSNYEQLQKAGVKIYEYKPGFIHAKQVVCDDEFAIVGTINFDYRSLIHHYENAIWMYKTSAIVDIKTDFDKIFDVSIDMKDYHQNVFLHLVCKVGEIFQPLL